MREHKYRAFGTDGKMHYDWLKINSHVSDTRGGITVYMASLAMITAVAVMEYTGQKDKKGRDVYEGDIFRYVDVEFAEPRIDFGAVLFSDKLMAWCIQFSPNEGEDGCMLLYDFSMEDDEVCGNIYENPEFVEP